MSDEQRFDTLSCCGSPVLKTPNIDSLAANGVRFTNCNTSYPLCCPSRVSLFTALRPDNHGVLANWRPMKPEYAAGNLIRQFKNMGYTTEYTGKWHITGTTPAEFGFDFYNAIPAVINGCDRGRTIPEYREYLKEKGYSLDNIDLENLTQQERQLLKTPGRAPCGTSRYKLEDYLEPWITGQWKAAMDKISGPFFSVCSFVAPHFPMVLPAPYDTMYKPVDVILPDNFFKGIDGKPGSVYKEHFYTHCKDLSPAEWKRLIAHYWGFCKLIDDQAGEIIQYLKQRNLYDNTVVCFISDHGDMMGSHGLLEKGCPMQYEEINRIPFVLRIPDLNESIVNDAMISITDVLPLIAQAADVSLDTTGTDAVPIGQRQYIVSQSFDLDIKKGPIPGGIPKYIEDIADFKKIKDGEDRAVISVKDKKFKYILHSDDTDEFYDLTADPGENINLAGDSSHCPASHIENINKYRKALLDEVKNNPVFFGYLTAIINKKGTAAE